jgi:hypothetical protein
MRLSRVNWLGGSADDPDACDRRSAGRIIDGRMATMNAASEAMKLGGGCQCGAVRYVLRALPEESSICHCRMCQKASGQPFMAFARVKANQLEWTRGAPALFQSSNLAERGFCSQCGTPLTYRFLADDTISVSACSLDDPRAAVPTIQYGAEGEVPWFATLATLPRMRTEEFLTAEQTARFANRQHPDRETD